jgi:hypothetical protein
MTAMQTNRVTAMTVLALAAFWGSACSSGSSSGVTGPTVTVRSEAGERATAKAVDGFASAVGSAYNRAVASQVSAIQAGFSGVPATGHAPMATTQGSCESVALKYFNAAGQQQPAYDPLTTTRVGANGPCSTPQGIVTLDATADDAEASSATVLINGTAQGTYEGYNVRVVATDVRMTKQFCGAPASGVLVATLDSLTAAVRFDGSLNVKATYTWNGIGVSFTVALQPCQ